LYACTFRSPDPVGATGVAEISASSPLSGLSLHAIWIDAVGELVLVAKLDAVVLLAVLRVGFASHRVAHAGASHQVALVARVDELLRLDLDRCSRGTSRIARVLERH